MICVKCNSTNTKCTDDILQVGYCAEIYICNECLGTIEVVYRSSKLSLDNIMEYRYTAMVPKETLE